MESEVIYLLALSLNQVSNSAHPLHAVVQQARTVAAVRGLNPGAHSTASRKSSAESGYEKRLWIWILERNTPAPHESSTPLLATVPLPR